METRRSMLSYLTGRGVAVGALVAGAGLMRSCAPIEERFTWFDFSDMAEGEIRSYAIANDIALLIRQGDALIAWEGRCPNDAGWPLMDESSFGGLFCPHCTRRYNIAGARTNRDGDVIEAGYDRPLQPLELNLDGMVLRVAEDELIPRQLWSSIW